MDETKEFARKVKAMRDSQKEFFKTRDGKVMLKAKQLEKDVDAALDRMDLTESAKTAPGEQLAVFGLPA